MTTRQAGGLAVLFVCLAGVALAQDVEAPLYNWGAPPYWTPPAAANDAGTEGEMQANAEGMIAQVQALPSSPLPFVAIAPCRIVDTRVAVSDGFHQPNFANDESRTFNFPSIRPEVWRENICSWLLNLGSALQGRSTRRRGIDLLGWN